MNLLKRLKRVASNAWGWVKRTARNIWEWIKGLFARREPKCSGGSAGKARGAARGSGRIAPTPASAGTRARRGGVDQSVPEETFDFDIELGSTGADDTREEPETKLDHISKNTDTSLTDQVFRARVRSVMLDNKYDRRVRARKRGKVDMTRLYKVRVKENNVFTQKQSRKGKKYNITLVLDQSGSMCVFGLIGEAARTIAYLAQHLDMPQYNISVRVIGFGWNVATYKDRNEKVGNYKTLERNLISSRGGTYTHLAIQDAVDEMKNLDGDNIIICVTDGYPESLSQTTGVIRANQDRAHIIGVGIGGYNCGGSFKHRVKVNSIDQLKPELIKILRRVIKRG